MYGARVTDAVGYFGRRGQARGVVRAVRDRAPDKFRWRTAASAIARGAGQLRGLPRMRLEEPMRELVVDLDNPELQREVVLDARRYRVDYDRGELLPFHRVGDLRRMTFLAGTDLRLIQRYIQLPEDFEAPIDTAAVALVCRAYADVHRKRSQKLLLDIPDPDAPVGMRPHQRYMAERAQHDADLAHRWTALSRAVLGQRG